MPDKVIVMKFLKHKAIEFIVQTADELQKWLTRMQEIAQAKAHKLFVVVVHGQCGIYLRPYPHHLRFCDLIAR